LREEQVWSWLVSHANRIGFQLALRAAIVFLDALGVLSNQITSRLLFLAFSCPVNKNVAPWTDVVTDTLIYNRILEMPLPWEVIHEER
jgi:hypothetical protein